MGVVVLKKPKRDELEDQPYEFRSSDIALRNFSRSTLCDDLVGILDDWIKGTNIDFRNCDLGVDVIKAAKLQGIMEGLETFKETLLILREKPIKEENKDDS